MQGGVYPTRLGGSISHAPDVLLPPPLTSGLKCYGSLCNIFISIRFVIVHKIKFELTFLIQSPTVKGHRKLSGQGTSEGESLLNCGASSYPIPKTTLTSTLTITDCSSTTSLCQAITLNDRTAHACIHEVLCIFRQWCASTQHSTNIAAKDIFCFLEDKSG